MLEKLGEAPQPDTERDDTFGTARRSLGQGAAGDPRRPGACRVLTWCYGANDHWLFTPCHEAKPQHGVSPHLYPPRGRREDLAALQPRVVKRDALCHVTVGKAHTKEKRR